MKMLRVLLAAACFGYGFLVQAGDLLHVSVINKSTGEQLHTWRYQGKNYVVGDPGDRYTVRLENLSDERILAVLSIDGVNAINGKTATVNQPGYVLGPHERQEIIGWRKSMDQAAVFYFTELEQSYAAQTGRPSNVGVIGVAVYQETHPVSVVDPYREDDDKAERGSSAESSSRFTEDRFGLSKAYPRPAVPEAKDSRRDLSPNVGTGHGKRVAAPSRYTTFNRRSTRPSKIVAIYYNSRENLIAQGIIPDARRSPEPFPGEFVPDPPR
jgi:hypothetical protein